MTVTHKVSADPDVSTRTALGVLRFVDPVTGQSVTEGLSVIARARNKAILATPSTRGVHIFHQLPGMSAASFWDGEDVSVAPSSYEFDIEVRDTSRRFFSTAFKTSFPAWPETAPICQEGDTLDRNIPLFSAPWRLPRNDLAIVRGTLQVSSTKKPAAWALLRAYRKDDDVMTATPVSQGVAGPDGEFMLMFPWPKADTPALAGPKGPHWSVRIQACYDSPGTQVSVDDLPDGEKRLPALCSILKQQPATLLQETGPDVELGPHEMTPGQTLLLRTSGEKVLYVK
jgi:hypothetical protein